MVVRLRLGRGRLVRRGQRKNQAAALGSAALLQPLALVGWLMAFWRLGGDLQWTRPFAITRGVFSHWQVWLGVGAILQSSVAVLNRYGLTRQPPISRVENEKTSRIPSEKSIESR